VILYKMDYYLPKDFISIERAFILDFNKNNKITPLYGLNIQKGGRLIEKYMQFIDDGGLYTYKIIINECFLDDANQVHIVIITNDEQECVTVIIDRDKQTAILHNMHYFNNCVMEGLQKPSNGTKLLRFALNMILQYKKKYNFNRILLKDNSYLPYHNKIKLADFRIILKGEPWYMKYGFKPYDAFKNKPSKTTLKILERNNKILSTLKTNSIDFSKIKKIDKKEIGRLANKHPLFRDFLGRLSIDLDKYGGLISKLLDIVYNVPGLESFYGKTYYLNI